MTEYRVILEATAARDLRGILRYITGTLKEPTIAKRVYNSIKQELVTLSQMPKRYNIIREEPYTSLGMRRLLVENYSAFYIIDEEQCEVHVLRILYSRREWQNLL